MPPGIRAPSCPPRLLDSRPPVLTAARRLLTAARRRLDSRPPVLTAVRRLLTAVRRRLTDESGRYAAQTRPGRHRRDGGVGAQFRGYRQGPRRGAAPRLRRPALPRRRARGALRRSPGRALELSCGGGGGDVPGAVRLALHLARRRHAARARLARPANPGDPHGPHRRLGTCRTTRHRAGRGRRDRAARPDGRCSWPRRPGPGARARALPRRGGLVGDRQRSRSTPGDSRWPRRHRLVGARRPRATAVIDGPDEVARALTHLSAVNWASTAYTALLASLIGYSLWNWLLAQHPASTVAPFTLLVPAVGMALAWIVDGERPGVPGAIGGALLVLGVALVSVGPRLLQRARWPRAAATESG